MECVGCKKQPVVAILKTVKSRKLCCHTYEHDIFVIFVIFLEINLLPRENNAIIVPFKYISLTIATAKALLFASRVVFGYRFTFGIVPSLLEYGKNISFSLHDIEFLMHPSEKSSESHFSGALGLKPGKHLHSNLLFGLQTPKFPQALYSAHLLPGSAIIKDQFIPFTSHVQYSNFPLESITNLAVKSLARFCNLMFISYVLKHTRTELSSH